MNSVFAIALNTFKETVRDRVLYAFVLFAMVLTLVGILLGSLSIQQNVRLLEDIGLFTISTIGGIVAIFVGTNMVYKELDKRTIYLIFTKPIRRWQFIVGKFLGLSLCIFIVTALMGGFLILLTLSDKEGASAVGPLISALGTIYLELVLVNAMATFFSTFATPLMSVLFTMGFWMCGHMGQSLLALSKMSQSAVVKEYFQCLYYLLPDLAKLTQIRFELLGTTYHFGVETLLLLTSYVLAYVVLLLASATVIIERREFS